MPYNSGDMIRNAREEFDGLLDYLSTQAHEEATAYQVERDLFTQLLALGRTLLALFFALCAQRSAQQPARDERDEAGEPLALHSYKPRR